jgi:hypothetical protein
LIYIRQWREPLIYIGQWRGLWPMSDSAKWFTVTDLGRFIFGKLLWYIFSLMSFPSVTPGNVSPRWQMGIVFNWHISIAFVNKNNQWRAQWTLTRSKTHILIFLTFRHGSCKSNNNKFLFHVPLNRESMDGARMCPHLTQMPDYIVNVVYRMSQKKLYLFDFI